MVEGKYVAYVGTYTHENSVGIHVYDLDLSEGKLTERSVAPINNPSYLIVAHNGKFLYSIEDEGVAAFSIDENGDLTKINQKWIGGMRGCYLDIDSKDRYLFVGGFHDGRVTMMNINEDGSIGEIADGIFHQGVAITAQNRRFDHPKVACVKLTPDEKFLCAADWGLNQVRVYRIDYTLGRLKLEDIVRCDLDSGPRKMRFSSGGHYFYVLTELNNNIEVYRYSVVDDEPDFERVQIIHTTDGKDDRMNTTPNMCTSFDTKYIFTSIDGFNGVSWFDRDKKEGTLTRLGDTKTSGYFPKSLVLLPGNEYILVLNHDSNQIYSFRFYPEKNYVLMKNPPINVDKPNCIKIHRLV